MADSNLDQIIAFLRGKGLTAAQAAGVAGNLKIESGYSPTAYNANEGAIGIAQWLGPRRTRLQQFAAARGSTETSLSTQLAFLWHELTGSESGSLKALQATSTPQDAAAIFDQRFERSSGSARAARIAAAGTIYQQIAAGTFQSSGNGNGTSLDTNGDGTVSDDELRSQLDPLPGPDSPTLGGKIVGGIVGEAVDNIEKFVFKAGLIFAGVGLIGLGVWRMSAPAREKAVRTVETVVAAKKGI